MAISMVAARLGGIIGNIVIAALLDLYCPLPTYIVAVLLIGQLQKYILSQYVQHLEMFFYFVRFRRRTFVPNVAKYHKRAIDVTTNLRKRL